MNIHRLTYYCHSDFEGSLFVEGSVANWNCESAFSYGALSAAPLHTAVNRGNLAPLGIAEVLSFPGYALYKVAQVFLHNNCRNTLGLLSRSFENDTGRSKP